MYSEKCFIDVIILEENKNFGIVRLSHLPKPGTLRVTCNDRSFAPDTTDAFGNPIFAEEKLKEIREFSKVPLSDFIHVIAEYDEQPFLVERESFDTISGILKSIVTFEGLCEMLVNRRKYTIANKRCSLNEFILFGGYLLTSAGGLQRVEKLITQTEDKVSKISKPLETEVTFKELKYNDYTFPFVMSKLDFYEKCMKFHISTNLRPLFALPEANMKCCCCHELITLEDFKAQTYTNYHALPCHTDCALKQKIESIKNDYISKIVSAAYPNNDCTFNIIQRTENDSIIYFILHTKEGTLYIGYKTYNHQMVVVFPKDFQKFKFTLPSRHPSDIPYDMWHKKGTKTSYNMFSCEEIISLLTNLQKSLQK